MIGPTGPQWQAGGPENRAFTGISRRSGLSNLPSSIQLKDRGGLQNTGL
jgi:hypothetical protein